MICTLGRHDSFKKMRKSLVVGSKLKKLSHKKGNPGKLLAPKMVEKSIKNICDEKLKADVADEYDGRSWVPFSDYIGTLACHLYPLCCLIATTHHLACQWSFISRGLA